MTINQIQVEKLHSSFLHQVDFEKIHKNFVKQSMFKKKSMKLDFIYSFHPGIKTDQINRLKNTELFD